MSIPQIVRTHLPSFCFQTMKEIVTFVEQINEDANPECIKQAVHKMTRNGEVVARRAKPISCGHNARRLEYARAHVA